MDSRNADKLLERGFSGDPPGALFRAKVLRDSSAALAHHRLAVRTWRAGAFSAAAVLIAAVSFLLGRCSVSPGEIDAPSPLASVAGDDGTAAVPNELVAWLDAARFFSQLGMEDRAARAYERASELVPREVTAASGVADRMLAAIDGREEQTDRAELPGLPRAAESRKWIIAQSWGD